MSGYDTVIIGAGMSGLAAGIRLAHFGKRVLIAERHSRIGGLNSWYERGGFLIESGLHAMTNFAAAGASKALPLMKLLRQLRLSSADLALRPQRHSLIHFPSAQLRFSNDFGLLESEVAMVFPSQVDGFRRLDALVRGYDDLSLLPVGAFLSAREVIGRHISDSLLADMLICPLSFYGSAIEGDMDFRQFVTMYKAVYAEGFARPGGGIRALLELLKERYETSGGELRLNCGIVSIETRNDAVAAVVTASGERIPCSQVLSCAGYAETVGLTGVQTPDELGIGYAERIDILEDTDPVSDGETIRFFSETDHFSYRIPIEPLALGSGVICHPRRFAFEPGDTLPPNAVRFTFLANPACWIGTSRTEYEAQKAVLLPRIDAVALRQSGIDTLKERTVLQDFFTPRTIEHFTGHRNGAVYGSPSKHYDGRTPTAGLYLCGTDQGFLGIVGAMLSGISIANSYLLK